MKASLLRPSWLWIALPDWALRLTAVVVVMLP